MSELKVNSIVDASSGNTVQINGQTPSESNMQGRNRIINGDMRIDQRNNGASVTITTSNKYTLDRWQAFQTEASKFSIQQNAGSVTPPVGFTNYLGATSLSAYAVAAGDIFAVVQRVEGFNIADLGWGSANAQTVTLSFLVRSSLTGTFGGSIVNNAANRSYPFTYSISAADTFEYKTVEIEGDTSGTWLTNNGTGANIVFGIGGGSTFSGTADAWADSAFFTATGAVSVVGTSGATFFITGVQLEAGAVATPFERRPFGAELALCQRYFQRIDAMTGTVANATAVFANVPFPIEMRANPTLGVSGAMTFSDIGAADFNQSSAAVVISGVQVTTRGVMADFRNFSGMTSFRPMLSLSATNRLLLSAEL